MAEPNRPCQVCGDLSFPFRRPWLFRCEECGVLSSTSPVEIPALPTAATIDEVSRSAGLDRLRHRNNVKLLCAIRRASPDARTMLDVGSGPGFLLRQARELGFEPIGIEPDANTSGEARRGYFPDILAPCEQFDAIVFNDVLEHIPDLQGALVASARHLRPGGILCLNCPDMRGLFYRVAAVLDRFGVSGPYSRLWQRGLPSPHVWYFTPALLAKAAAADFEPTQAVRLETIELRGLWQRIMAVKGSSRLMAVASVAFAWATYPLAALLPSDASAVIFRRR